jgi:hypothetical protein
VVKFGVLVQMTAGSRLDSLLGSVQTGSGTHQVKLSLYSFNKALRHEDVWEGGGGWMYISTHS